MLDKFLKKSDCKACQFCCSYRRKSLWETPPFYEKQIGRLQELCPEAKFKVIGDGVYTIDLGSEYRTEDPEEEAKCPFNQEGCILSEEDKPFICALWPLRIMREGSQIVVSLSDGCPVFSNVANDDVRSLVEDELADAIRAYAKAHPEAIEDMREDYEVISYLPEGS